MHKHSRIALVFLKLYWRLKLDSHLDRIVLSYDIRRPERYAQRLLRYKFCKKLVDQPLEKFSSSLQFLTMVYSELCY